MDNLRYLLSHSRPDRLQTVKKVSFFFFFIELQLYSRSYINKHRCGSLSSRTLLPTYGSGGDWLCGGGGRQGGGGEFLGPELVVSDEAVGRQAEI